MASTEDDLTQMRARNAAMKNTVDEMLEQLDKQTQQLKDMQSEIANVFVTATSADGLVKAKVDASGTLVDLQISPHAFNRTTPEQLAKSVQRTVRNGTNQVKKRIAELTEPMSKDMPDLPDFFAGAPSLTALMPDMAIFAPREDPAEEQGFSGEDKPIMQSSLSDPVGKVTTGEPRAPKPRSTSAISDESEEPPTSWLTGRGS